LTAVIGADRVEESVVISDHRKLREHVGRGTGQGGDNPLPSHSTCM